MELSDYWQTYRILSNQERDVLQAVRHNIVRLNELIRVICAKYHYLILKGKILVRTYLINIFFTDEFDLFEEDVHQHPRDISFLR
jgi:hypothetical protein